MATALAGLLSACGDGGEGTAAPVTPNLPALSAINVSIGVAQLRVGDSTVARAVGITAGGGTVTLDSPGWSSDAPDVVSVSGTGLVTAGSEGEATLTATAGGKSGTLRVRVQPQPVTKVVLSRSAITLAPTVSLTLFATTLGRGDNVISGRAVAWTTSDATIAVVSQDGRVTGVGPGSALVTATSEGVSASTAVTITSGIGSVARLELNAPTATLTAGERLQLTAMAYDATGAALPSKPIAWTVSIVRGTNSAAISDSGLVTALAAGIVVVEAESEHVSAAVTITVRDNVDPTISVDFAKPVKDELIGDTLAVFVAVGTKQRVERVEVKVLSRIYSLRRELAGSFNPQEVWVTEIDVTDVPSGNYEIVATATMEGGILARGAITFQRDTRVGKGGSSQPPKQK